MCRPGSERGDELGWASAIRSSWRPSRCSVQRFVVLGLLAPGGRRRAHDQCAALLDLLTTRDGSQLLIRID